MGESYIPVPLGPVLHLCSVGECFEQPVTAWWSNGDRVRSCRPHRSLLERAKPRQEVTAWKKGAGC